MSARYRAKRRDQRDDRIRSLEAELRITHTNLVIERENSAEQEKKIDESAEGDERRNTVISHQQVKIDDLSKDLKESVIKTRELRSDLTERATENIKSEVKLREVETELSVAQASTDMIATGVLDYSVNPDEEVEVDEGNLSKTAT
jgi:hypothetical protein